MRFVILRHSACPDQPDHYDLLLQLAPGTCDDDRVLAAFHSDVPPFGPETVLKLQRLPDHRRLYLSYEGPVSGGRGNVKQVAAGPLELYTPIREPLLRLAFRVASRNYELRHNGGAEYLLTSGGLK